MHEECEFKNTCATDKDETCEMAGKVKKWPCFRAKQSHQGERAEESDLERIVRCGGKLYLAIAGVSHEGYDVMCAFVDEVKAKDFVKICEEYKGLGTSPDMEADDSEWDEWDVKLKLWQENHPGGESGYIADYFSVIETTLNT